MTEALISDVLRSTAVVTLAIFLAWLIFKVFARFTAEMDASEKNSRPGVWLEANWGGLGGGLSGWRVSNAVIYLLLMSLLLGCLSLAVFSLHPTTEKKAESQDDLKKDGGKKDGPKRSNEKNDPDKKDDAGDVKPGEATQSGQKQGEPKKGDTTGGKGGEKSSTAPARTKNPAVNQTVK